MNELEDVIKNNPDVDASVYLNKGRKQITLSKIFITNDKRNLGVGTKFMTELIQFADDHGYKIILTPSSDYGGSLTKLKNFYPRFGFIPNKGKYRDYSHREDMYRLPQEPLTEEDGESSSDSKSWGSGVTRGKANPISNHGNWESNVTRGKANPISNHGNWESGVTRGKANPINEITNRMKQLMNLTETISPDEAYTDEGSFKTLIDKKRGIGFLGNEYIPKLEHYGLEYILTKNKYNVIVYYKEYSEYAHELAMIINKYNGALPSTLESGFYKQPSKVIAKDIYRIGIILGYHPKSVEDFILTRMARENTDFKL